MDFLVLTLEMNLTHKFLQLFQLCALLSLVWKVGASKIACYLELLNFWNDASYTLLMKQ